MEDDGRYEPRKYHCPRCKVNAGDPCISPYKNKVEFSHTARQDLLIWDFNEGIRR